ncbi:MAG: hypothetical protein WAL63_13005 [Solirubrobacteraceae bacterium]
MRASLIVTPLRIGVRIAGWAAGGVRIVAGQTEELLELVGHVLGPDGGPGRDEPPPPRTRVAEPVPASVRTETVVADPVPARPHVAEPVSAAPREEDVVVTDITEAAEPLATEAAHVSETPELVEEFADPGAQDGAGAEVRIAEPWEDYRSMNAADIVERIAAASREELAAIELYELSGRKRRSVLDAAAAALKRASPPY